MSVCPLSRTTLGVLPSKRGILPRQQGRLVSRIFVLLSPGVSGHHYRLPGFGPFQRQTTKFWALGQSTRCESCIGYKPLAPWGHCWPRRGAHRQTWDGEPATSGEDSFRERDAFWQDSETVKSRKPHSLQDPRKELVNVIFELARHCPSRDPVRFLLDSFSKTNVQSL